MPFETDNKLVIAVSSRALFDLDEANHVFESEGEKAYMKYQWDNKEKILDKGVAFPFIKRLLQFSNPTDATSPVEVIVLSKNDPASGIRFFKSCEHYDLNITRGVFTAGRDPFPYIDAFDCCLFLSANKEDIDNATQLGHPAGLILPSNAPDDPVRKELVIAFDFDGVLIDDSSEQVYQTEGIGSYMDNERKNASIPAPPGPLKKLIEKLSQLQKLEIEEKQKNPSFSPKLRIAIVTARNAPAHERVITTLQSWGINAVEAFFLGGLEKRKVLSILKPHVFFDDQMTHLAPASTVTPSVHIPFGIINNQKSN